LIGGIPVYYVYSGRKDVRGLSKLVDAASNDREHRVYFRDRAGKAQRWSRAKVKWQMSAEDTQAGLDLNPLDLVQADGIARAVVEPSIALRGVVCIACGRNRRRQ